ncbi:MAG: hypothetical protein HUJ76_09175, partial [Parasporobacterium sp.]|nr:hypothetical protein [Parasporobacterium sp.]
GCGAEGESATGHDFTDPSCTEAGYCRACGAEGESATGHSFTEPTCTEAGYCTGCGAEGESATGHSFTEPTCTEAGYCKACGAEGEKAKGHSFNEPTCTEAGYCRVCGAEVKAALGHDWMEMVEYRIEHFYSEPKTVCTTCQNYYENTEDLLNKDTCSGSYYVDFHPVEYVEVLGVFANPDEVTEEYNFDIYIGDYCSRCEEWDKSYAHEVRTYLTTVPIYYR